ncbi:hypothetical protein C6558_35215 [Ensifer sp. NM-2]|uniref:DNA methyltransferase n=1 Tax=Ensifer sp. NM-2 TaxID=2109730 RepID=UPI000D133E8A|nr:DNA methyltransferase [Ensifer sp. NM-2]PSS59950.1 hypothetical protein C6558_35215 [Ensifer sp. NM-2]
MSDQAVFRQLSFVDWDFIERGPLDISALHWYPGSFAPGLPGVLVDLLSSEGDTIFDPFCGIGSTAAAAILRGRHSVSCDINPVGVMSGLTTTGLISLLMKDHFLFEAVLDDLRSIVEEIRTPNAFLIEALQSGSTVDEHIDEVGGRSVSNVLNLLFKQPATGSLSNWYHPRTLDELKRLLDFLESSRTARFTKIVGFTMLSAIARGTCSETRSWGHVADNVRPREFVYKDAGGAALAWIKRTRRQLDGIRRTIPITSRHGSFDFSVIDWNNDRFSMPCQAPALLLTSPPYGGAIDYGLAQRLTMYFLGKSDDEIANLVNSEIGARRKRFKPGHINTWAEQLIRVATVQLSLTSGRSVAAYVMPHKDHGRDAGEVMLKSALEEDGWELWFSADRSVRQSRTRQSWTSIKKETILVFRRKS